MPKPKQFLKAPKKKSKHTQLVPETADEYLAAGVDFEEAGEKWRGGDASKSTRFFVRAIDCYVEALKKFPGSFDLAYNKARVQYELTQHPKLLLQLPGSLLELLQTALESSRYALRLNNDNADALFNTAQILTSLSEKLSESPLNNAAALHLIEEALKLFQQCLEVQEKQAQETAAQAQLADSMFADTAKDAFTQFDRSTMVDAGDISDTEQGGVSLIGNNSSMDVDNEQTIQDERWATIVEPVTNDVLLDTALAQLEALTHMCGLITNISQEAISWIEQYAKDLIQIKLQAYTANTTRGLEANITRAAFISALTNLQLQAGLTTPKAYFATIQTAYDLPLTTSAPGLSSYADSLLAFNSALRSGSFPQEEEHLITRWEALTTALAKLTAASKIYGAENLPKIHIARGDAEIWRFQLGAGEDGQGVVKAAIENRDVLLRNAMKFYAGAGKVAASYGPGWEEESAEAETKEFLAKGLLGDGAALKSALKHAKGEGLVADMIDEGLVTNSQLVGMGIGS